MSDKELTIPDILATVTLPHVEVDGLSTDRQLNAYRDRLEELIEREGFFADDPGMMKTKRYFLRERLLERAMKTYQKTYKQRQEEWRKKNTAAIAKREAENPTRFREEHYRYLEERLAGVNDPIGAEILAIVKHKLSAAA